MDDSLSGDGAFEVQSDHFSNQGQRRYAKVSLGEDQCIHSRKLFALLDNISSSAHLRGLEDHLYECIHCRKYYAEVMKLKKLIDDYIPIGKVSSVVLEGLCREIEDILRTTKVVTNPRHRRGGLTKLLKGILSLVLS